MDGINLVHPSWLCDKSNYKGLYDFTVIFEDMYNLMPKLEECLLMAFFNNPLFKEEQGIVYVDKTLWGAYKKLYHVFPTNFATFGTFFIWVLQ